MKHKLSLSAFLIVAVLVIVALAMAQQFQPPDLVGNEQNAVVYIGANGHSALSPSFTFDGTNLSVPGVKNGTAGLLPLQNPTLKTAGAKPTCAVGYRGELWFTAAAAGAADTLEVCAKAANDSYAWTALY
jgi:hypothetical protein